MKLASFVLRTLKCNSNVRLISASNVKWNKYAPSQSTMLKGFTPVYKFPYIRALSIVNRLKLYHTVFTGIAIPGSFILSELNLLDTEGIVLTAVLGFTGCVVLYGLGSLADKFIGFVYLNKQENIAKVAYVDYWGRRRDIEVPLRDVVPFSEIPVSIMDGLYSKFNRFSEKEILKINLKYGQVLDKEKYDKVFGSYIK